jgi:hypothetical protein
MAGATADPPPADPPSAGGTTRQPTPTRENTDMALAEKHLADTIIEWRQQQATGDVSVPITDAIDVAVEALIALQASRAQLGRMADLVEAATS